jgi:DNA-binding HxlR family transcriptional regulator
MKSRLYSGDMALRRTYEENVCPIARSLEVIGERWTLLIIRDAFYGVRRFSDFRTHLGIPPAVLTERLKLLVDEEIMTTELADSGREEYLLTKKGERLWPTVWSLMSWGNEYYIEKGLRRPIVHTGCGGRLEASGRCDRCDELVEPRDLEVHPRRLQASVQREDRVSRLLAKPHRLIEPLTSPT